MKGFVSVLTSRRRLRRQLALPLFRNALYLMAGSAVTGVSGLIFWLVAAHLHDADTVGLASAAISAMLLMSTLGTLGLDYAIIRFLPNSSDPKAMINTCLTVGGLASAVMAAVFVAGVGFWSPVLLFIRRDPLLFIGFVAFTAAYTVFLVQTRTFVARRRAEFSLAQSLAFSTLRVILLVVLAISFGVFGIVSSWGIAVVLALAVGVVFFQPRLEARYRPVPAISGKVVDQLVRYSFTNYVVAMLSVAPGYVLPLLVANLVGAESNAYFYIAWCIASVLYQVPVSISYSLFAEGSTEERTLGRNVRKSLLFTLVTVGPGILLLALFADVLLGYFEPQYADSATGLLRVLSISALPISLNTIYFVVERVRMRMGRVIVMNVFLTAATLGLSWALLPRMGLAGAGIAWIASQSAAALGVVLLLLLTSHVGEKRGN